LGRSRSPVFFRRPLIPVIFAWDTLRGRINTAFFGDAMSC
jgi:hypothetical protein